MDAPPDFIERSPDTIVAEMVADIESRSGKTLYPAQPERLLIDFMAYRESLLRSAVQDAASLNLVRFSRDKILDELATDRGMQRMPAYAAGCTLEFCLPAVHSAAVRIPAGTVVATGDGAVSVVTRTAAVLPAGRLTVSVPASAQDAGTAGNGYVPGQISQLVSILPDAPAGLTVTNTSATEGGADAETDARLQQRLLLAFDSYSVGGPAPAYRIMAMNQHPDVISVAVVSHDPGIVTLYPLTSDGPAGPTVLAAVQRGVSADEVRVLSDTVRTVPPVARPYAVRGRLTLRPGADPATVLAQAESAVRDLVDRMAGEMGGDIVPSQFIGVLQPLVHRVELDEPASFSTCESWHWRQCTGIDLRQAG
ncbi:baseplate J/gp47 family protein [Microvirgula curvata]